MKPGWSKLLIAFAMILTGFGAVYLLSNFLAQNRVALPDSYSDSDLALQGKRLKGFALGAEGLLADWYWMMSLQYVGDKLAASKSDFINLDDLRSLNPRLLHPYLDNATDLDPQFMAAYTYGAIVLPAIDPSLAIDLTEKGITNNPDAWKLYQYLGYIHWRLKDYEKASETYERGSRIKGAGDFMKMMAASLKTRGGSRETARALYKELLAEAADEQTKGVAELRLMEIEFLDERDAIRAALRSARGADGPCPASLKVILPALSDVKLPFGKEFRIDTSNNLVDPSGAPYVLDQETCDVKPDPARTKLPPILDDGTNN